MTFKMECDRCGNQKVTEKSAVPVYWGRVEVPSTICREEFRTQCVVDLCDSCILALHGFMASLPLSVDDDG